MQLTRGGGCGHAINQGRRVWSVCVNDAMHVLLLPFFLFYF